MAPDQSLLDYLAEAILAESGLAHRRCTHFRDIVSHAIIGDETLGWLVVRPDHAMVCRSNGCHGGSRVVAAVPYSDPRMLDLIADAMHGLVA